jgi:hypothetical protein
MLLQLTILAALKLTRAKAQNIIFVASGCVSGNTEYLWCCMVVRVAASF